MEFLSQERQAEVRAIAERQQKTYRQMLSANKNKTFAIHAIHNLHRQIDELVTRVQARPDVRFDCKPGCSHCCNFRIEVFPPEVFVLARRLRALPGDQLSLVTERLRLHVQRSQGVPRAQHWMNCPLLIDDRCSVYEDRPSTCRKYLSLDVEECKRPGISALEDGELALKSLALVSGVREAYSKAKSPLSIHEMSEALLMALTDPSCEERWFKGEVVFPLMASDD